MRIFIVVFLVLGSVLAREKPKTQFAPIVQERVDATETALATLEGFVYRMKSVHDMPMASRFSSGNDGPGTAWREKARILSQEVVRDLGFVIAVDCLRGVDGHLASREYKKECRDMFRWARNVNRRLERAEGFFEDPIRFNSRVVIHLGEWDNR